MAIEAGFFAKVTGPFPHLGEFRGALTLILCVKGAGWCDIKGRLQAVRPGDLLMIPPNTPHLGEARTSAPCTLHWARAAGSLLPDYLEQLKLGCLPAVLHVGEDPELIRLFGETERSLRRGGGLAELLRASHALAHLLAVLIKKRHGSVIPDVDTTQKVAEAIIYMSEHIDQPVRVSALARAAGLSPTYFSGLFKQQAGCAPRDYLHLLRMHRACHLLRTTQWSVKRVASSIGYQDQFHFSRQFKAFQGALPTDYRAARPA